MTLSEQLFLTGFPLWVALFGVVFGLGNFFHRPSRAIVLGMLLAVVSTVAGVNEGRFWGWFWTAFHQRPVVFITTEQELEWVTAMHEMATVVYIAGAIAAFLLLWAVVMSLPVVARAAVTRLRARGVF